MARRFLATAAEPDVEKSRAELEHLEGQKHSASGEVISLGDTKKSIEKNISQLEEKEKEILDRIDAYEMEEANAKRRAEAATDQSKKDIGEVDTKKTSLNEEIKAIDDFVMTRKAYRDGLESAITVLDSGKKDKEEEIKKLTNDLATVVAEIRVVEVKLDLSKKDKAALDEIISIKNAEVDSIKKRISDLNSEIPALEEIRSSKSNELRLVNEKLVLKTNELIGVEDELISVRKTIEEEKKIIEEEKVKSADRLNTVSVAEAHIIERTDYLKRLIEKAKADSLIKDFQI